MKILYLHRTQGKGVEGVHIREMVKAFTDLGHRVDVLSPTGLKNDVTKDEGRLSGVAKRESNLAKTEGTKNKIYSIISKILPEFCFEILEIFYNFVATKKLGRILSSKKYDLIYERYAIFNWAGIKAAKNYRIPIILEVNYTSFTPLYRKRSMILKPFAHWVDKKIFAAANGIVVVSTALKEHLISLGVSPEKIIVCTNAADPDKFNPDISGAEIKNKFNLNGKKVIGFVGGFYPWHGLDSLIDTFAAIKNEFGDAVLFLIGEGPAKKSLQKKIADLNLKKDVILAGTVSHDVLPKYIAAFDIAVMPDSNSYGSPMKIYEYMAIGKPVVAPRLGPLEDGMQDGREGLLFSPKNREELSKSLKTLLVNNQLRQSMSAAARENILKKHTWQKIVEAILKLSTSTINDAGNKKFFAK